MSLMSATAHWIFAKTTREIVGARKQRTAYRVECSCGWESQWTLDWEKSYSGHIYREQRRALNASEKAKP